MKANFRLKMISEVQYSIIIAFTSISENEASCIYFARVVSKSPYRKQVHPRALKGKEAHGLVFDILRYNGFLRAY